MGIEYTDNSVHVKAVLSESIRAFLYEAGGELQAQAMRNSRVDTGHTKGSYQYKVEQGVEESTVYVGSNAQNAIWEEFGTGEYALNGNGRKNSWVYQNPKDGKFYRTKGKRPNRPLYRAFNSLRGKLNRHLEQIIKARME